MNRQEEKECNCDLSHDDFAVIHKYFMLDGIERKGMYCNICDKLLDYIPQYNED